MPDFLQYCRMFDSAAIGVAAADLAGHFVYANQAYADTVGYTLDELSVLNFCAITHADDLSDNIRAAEKMMTGEYSSAVYEKRYLRKDGGFTWVRNSVSPVKDQHGVVTNFIALVEDLSLWKESEERMNSANRRLRQLSSDLLRSQDYERRRIARELHDSTAQLLAGLTMNLSRLKDADVEPDRRAELLTDATELATQCSREIRGISYLLHPPLLDELGLASALQTYAEGFQQRTGVVTEVRVSSELGRFNADTETTIFRIVQEGLANVYRHSGSSQAVITLERDLWEVRLELLDRGRGLPAVWSAKKRSVRLGVGVLGMRERAELLGGQLEIKSGPEGTKVIVVLPLNGTHEKVTNSARG